MSDVEVVSYRPDPSEFAWTFGGVPPVRTVSPGTVLELWTEDAFGGKVRGPDDLVREVIEFPFVNPQTGPFLVEGAEPGDTLAVHFVSIEPARDWAASTHGAAVRRAHRRRTPPPTLQRAAAGGGLDLRRRPGRADRDLPVDRAASTSRSAAARPDARDGRGGAGEPGGAVRRSCPTRTAGTWTRRRCAPASTCYLGVNVEGALFSIGDGHCRQGEGETCGVAVEAAMDTVLIVDLIKGGATPWPRLESDTHLMSTGSARPLEDAFRISQRRTWSRGWPASTGSTALDAYQLLTQAAEVPFANVVDPNYTVLAKIRKSYLPSRTPTAARTPASARWRRRTGRNAVPDRARSGSGPNRPGFRAERGQSA